MKLKTGKEEIVCLLTKVIEKYELETGHQVIRNSNRKHYEEVAKMLSDISNELPDTSETKIHDTYSIDVSTNKLQYPFRKYDITGNQIKDAYFNQIVSNPRPFLVDACYIYLFGMGRKGFEKNPVDNDLLKITGPAVEMEKTFAKPLIKNVEDLHDSKDDRDDNLRFPKISQDILIISLIISIAAFSFVLYKWVSTKNKWETVRKDMNLLPYQPTKAEVDSLEGVWLCYTGSPQARNSDPNRYHMVVSNVIDVKYKDGYFTFLRYGASFDHIGYMQFEAPWLVSIHSYVKNGDSIESPRHSLMWLGDKRGFVSVISASWNFDIGNRNSIIGIREIYIKQGKNGKIEEVMNTIENAGCHCKILKWQQSPNKLNTFYLKNMLLDSLPDETVKDLINEKSILLRLPQDGLIYPTDSLQKRN